MTAPSHIDSKWFHQNQTPAKSAGVTHIKLTNFRSYESLSLTCALTPVVITGANGSGKTNILEALSFLSPGRGFRQAKLTDVLRRSDAGVASQWAVHCALNTQYGPLDVGTGLTVIPGESEKRQVRIQKEDVKSQLVLGDHISVQWLTPQMDRIFVDGATARRKFLDRLVYSLDPTHASRVLRYEHVMRERLKILKSGGLHQTSWLSSLEAKMAESGVSIAAARLQTLLSLMQAKAQALGIFPKAILSLDGMVEKDLATKSALDAEDHLLHALKQTRQEDAESGRTNVGPHRSELVVFYEDKKQLAEQCSTGEQKALLISIIMAAARLQTFKGDQVPLLLLDEVVAHLDENRRACLFDEIISLGIQAWMTGTDASDFLALGDQAQRFTFDKTNTSVLAA